MIGIDATERDRQIATTVTRAARQSVRHLSHLDERLSRLECERLSLRIRELSEADAARAPFHIEAVEDDRNWTLAGLHLRMRADRVDRLGDGSLLYVDYKTGTGLVGDWLGVRLKEPQLPLYVLASPGDVAGVAYGSLAAGKVGYRGLAQEAIEATDIGALAASRAALTAGLDTWDKLLMAWRQSLTDIASAFVDGEAQVRPRRISEDCRYCHLSVLCRRHELTDRGVLIDE